MPQLRISDITQISFVVTRGHAPLKFISTNEQRKGIPQLYLLLNTRLLQGTSQRFFIRPAGEVRQVS